MKTNFVSLLLAVLLGILPNAAGGKPERISEHIADLGEVMRVYLAQGLAAVVQLPYPITELKVGNPDDVQAHISKTLPSELTLILKRGVAQPTNLIVRCGLRTFVFDLIPSKATHQDLVRISGSYGGPDHADLGAKLIDSSGTGGKARLNDDNGGMVLIDSSGAAR